jgi:hypothetical protein
MLLQAAPFGPGEEPYKLNLLNQYIGKATLRLGLPVMRATVSDKHHTTTPEAEDDKHTVLAWYEAPDRIYVWREALKQSPDVLRILAHHEVCHRYLHPLYVRPLARERSVLNHDLVRYCTISSMGRDTFLDIVRRNETNDFINRVGTMRWWRSHGTQNRRRSR